MEQQSVILLEGREGSHLDLCTYHFEVELIGVLVQSFLLQRPESILLFVVVTGEEKNNNQELFSSFSVFTPAGASSLSQGGSGLGHSLLLFLSPSQEFGQDKVLQKHSHGRGGSVVSYLLKITL